MTAYGAYGLQLPGIDTTGLVADVPDSWPEWRLAFEVASGEPPQLEVGPNHAVLPHMPTGHSIIDRERRQTTLVNTQTAHHAVIHPLLGATALMTSEWSDRVVLHGGAFIDPSGLAWGVLGDRGAGKSSLLAWCLVNGLQIVTDDLIATDGDGVLAGPRCLDLRRSAATHFGIGDDIGVIGSRRRWRTQTSAIQPTTPLAGWVIPRWGSSIDIISIAVDRRSIHLNDHRALRVKQQHPLAWMKMLAKPMVTFVRPQSWNDMDRAMEAMMAALVDSRRPIEIASGASKC